MADRAVCENCVHRRGSRGRQAAWCAKRDIVIRSPGDTTCDVHNLESDVEGPLISLHWEERLPWRGNHEPRPCRVGVCRVCGTDFLGGVEIKGEEGLSTYCGPGHYLSSIRAPTE